MRKLIYGIFVKQPGSRPGAFYFSFANKEALLAAILDPVIADYERMCSMFAQREEEDPAPPRQSSSWISVPEAGMRCSEHRLNYRCRQHLPVILRNLWGRKPDAELIRILVSMRLQGYMELIKGDYTVDERVRMSREIGIHADAGTAALIKYLNQEHEACRK